MLRIMLRVVASGSRPIRHVLPVGVVYEGVVPIDRDIIVATPAIVVAPAASPSGSHWDSDAERNRHTRCIILRWRISNGRIRISGRAVDYGWVITGNINNIRIRLLDNNDLFVFDDLSLHFFADH